MIDKFFVVDFDRCLGSVDKSFNLMIDIVKDLDIIDSRELSEARRKSEAKRKAFSVFGYIKEVKTNVDFDLIENEYIKRSKNNPIKLQEPGAARFIDCLKAQGEYFCIMSYGDPHWQSVKIAAAGFDGVPVVLIDIEQKSKVIAKWYNEKTSKFVIPSKYFIDKISRETDEVILIDDKQSAFDDLTDGIRGYWVENLDSPNAIWSGETHRSVQKISKIDEIIDLEFKNAHS